MERIDGVELARTKLEPHQVLPVLDLVLAEAAGAYDRGYVHADLSEYNVFVHEQGVTVFDWPQAVPTDHENARELLSRDAGNLVGYFQRKYPAEVDEIDVDALTDALAEGDFESVEQFLK
jgi:RIO kinase 2